MLKKISKIVILNILIGILFSSTVAYAGWKESDPSKGFGDWEFNAIKYFSGPILIEDNKSRFEVFPKDPYDELVEYIHKGYVIKYYVKMIHREIEDGIFLFKFNGKDIEYSDYGASGTQSNFGNVYYTRTGLWSGFSTDICFEANRTNFGRFSSRDWLKIWLTSKGKDGDDMQVKDVYFKFALLDEAQPNIVSIKYYTDQNLTNEITSGSNPKLSYNGSHNSVYMAVEFDEDVFVKNTDIKNFIRTSLTLKDKVTNKDTEVGSFQYDRVDTNKVVFKYQVRYGAQGELFLRNEDKNKFLKEIESFKIQDKYDNEFKSSFRAANQAYSSGKEYNIRVDGIPPEIPVEMGTGKTGVEYNIIGGNEQYLSVGDILEVKLKFDSEVKVSSDGFMQFNNINQFNNTRAKAKLYLDNDKIQIDKIYTYNKDEWIVYRYVVRKGDDTSKLTFENEANPMGNLQITDDFGNVGQMPRTGEEGTKNFPAVAYKKGNEALDIFVDTIPPRIDFGNKDFTTYRNQHVVSLSPIETGSMLVNGEFDYVISKSNVHPTNGSLKNCLGSKSRGYSSGGGTINIPINDDLYKKTKGYTQYDEIYDEINMTGKYENVNYVDGTASDVIHDGRREITGIFYIHTYIEDKAGNKTWGTSQPIYMDNTHAKIKISPNGTTSKYVGDINVNFELLGEEPSGFNRYEYRWVSPIELEEKKLDKKDIYKDGTDTYKLLRENTSSWKQGNSLNSYSISKIPIPSFEQRQHGVSYLLIRAYDNATRLETTEDVDIKHNISYILSEPYYFDKEKPVVQFKSESGGFDKPLDNHKIKVTIDDKDSKLVEFKYYFSNSYLTRDPGNKIWKQLELELPNLPDDYDPFEEYKNNGEDQDKEDLLTKQAIVETNKWNEETSDEETLNGHVFLHIYAKDSCGNEIIARQNMKIDNNGLPMISFYYDNAIGNRYKTVTGHINCSDDGGIKTLEYKWSQTKDMPQEYNSIDISKFDNKNDLRVDTDPFDTSGEWYLHVRATDIYDNMTNSISEKYIINSTAPAIGLFQVDNSKVYISKEKNIAISINKLVDDKLEYTYVVYNDQDCKQEIKRGTFSNTSEIVNIQLNENDKIQEYYFKFYDSLNQVTEKSIKIQAIYDNIPPTAKLIYSPNKEQGVTSNNVIVTLNNISDNVSDKDNIIVSESMYTFTENGEHIFTLTDEIGNETTHIAKVTWIKDDKPIVRVNTSNIYGQSYKSLSFNLSAQRPIESGYIDIQNPNIYYQFSKLEDVEDKDYIKYNNGETISLSESDGEYYLHTKLVDGERIFTNVYGKYILDNTINEPKLTYTYEDSKGTQVDCTKEQYDALLDVSSIVKVRLEFDEDIVIKSVINNKGENLPCVNKVMFYNNDNITVTYMDKAGNEASKVINIDNIKHVNNKGIISITPNKATNDKVTVIIKAPSNKRINNIRVDDTVIDMGSITTTKAEDSEDNYLTAEFTVTENVNIKVDIFDKDDKDTVVVTEEYDVTNIDKTPPTGDVVIKNIDKYTKTASIIITDENPTVITNIEFIKEDEKKVHFDTTKSYTSNDIIYNHITNLVTTKINGTIKYYFEDSAGNKGEAHNNINTINTNLDMNKVSATYKVGDVTYNDIPSIGIVNKDVEVTVKVPEGYYIVNNSSKNTRLFVVGIKYDFLISNGINIGKFSVDLTNTIKKSGPKLKLNYTIDGKVYTDELVNGKTSNNVLLTITSEDNISKVVFDSVEDLQAPYSYEFSENKIINIIAIDTMGNTTTLKASIDCIDKEPVRAGLFSLYTKPTKDNIKLQFLATKPVDILEIKKDGNIYDNTDINAVDKYEFTVIDNGNYSVKYRDDIGNESIVSLEVNNIDREDPIVKILYNGKETKPVTNDVVMASIVLVNKNQEPHGIKVLNTIGNTNSYLFKENGKFTFKVTDMAGNETQITAEVDSIDRDPVSYTVSYSETNLTKNDVVATITIGENNYKILNSDIDQNNNANSVNKNVMVTGNRISIRFTDNGYYQLYVSDEAGNKSTILLRVKNIDRIKPIIKLQNDYVVTLKGVMPKLNDVIAYDTHDGDIKEKVNISSLDVSTVGDKKITYTVSDTAGNIASLERVVKVIGDDYTIIVNGKINPSSFYSNSEETDIKVFNFVENATIKYIKGIVKDGEFKQDGQVYSILLDTIDDKKLGNEQVKLSLNELGWYTIYIMDLNRQKASFTVYFTE
ncbi:immunoglobulin-like domain-containing protein [Vallitalea sp.]|jgi:hypothetical protein|uniref:immunoglobulin-like domain-containing protein n=1 Tax=Vallitalea sp. TaxID=1882829 RepID=UPI0025F7A192|nr:immunoglobulin-like domain-containing protein [Vallitalea sp.]MCT4686315.1 DUF5011 domain-containing protein [Vallitalea sp.]